MGVQYRKRTKGKKNWFNFSASETNGVGVSHSTKIGNATINVGSKGRRRLTINLGNGLRYVKSKIIRKQKVENSSSKSKGLAFQEREELLNFDVEECIRSIDGEYNRPPKDPLWTRENTTVAMLTVGVPAIFIILTGFFAINIFYSIGIALLTYVATVFFISDDPDKATLLTLPLLLLLSPVGWTAIITTASLTVLLYIFTH